MKAPHISFIVDPTQGHVNPILGIVSELASRGCRVTCAVNDFLSLRVTKSGGEPVVYEPLDYRRELIPKVEKCEGDTEAIMKLWAAYEQAELHAALPQLEKLYREDRPDLIIYDLRSLVGQALAKEWSIPKVEHSPQFIYVGGKSWVGRPYDDRLVIVSIPRAFQPRAAELDERFHFVGPVYNSRQFFEPWSFDGSSQPEILVGATTAIPQPQFFSTVIEALRPLACKVILSVGNDVDPASFGSLPPNFQINRFSSHLEILRQASLFVCQAGIGSVLEAFSCGVPALVIPPSSLHDEIAVRVAELGLGRRLEGSATPEEIRESVLFLLQDTDTKGRVLEMQKVIHGVNGAQLAGDLILGCLDERLTNDPLVRSL